ncbi:MAG: GNAT family N-acetyltransferase [Bacteroidia bacterium]
MIIRNFGITLSQLTLEDIELVRYWRNSKEISSVMEYQKFITEEEQKKWFNSLNPLSDFYFLINYNGVKVGLIHTSHINWKDKTADAGLFVWDKNYLGTHIPVLASLAMLECFFENFGLEKYSAKVGRENKVAIRYNLTLGFQFHEKSSDTNFDFYVLKKQNYLLASEKLKRFAATVSSEKPQLEIASELLNELKKLNV